MVANTHSHVHIITTVVRTKQFVGKEKKCNQLATHQELGGNGLELIKHGEELLRLRSTAKAKKKK